MITRMPPYNIFEELPKIANQVREISEDLGAELDFAVEAMRTTFEASTARTDGWVSVEERLPEDSEIVLLFHRDGIVSVTTFGVRDKGKWLDYNNTTDDYPNEIRKITHWQPLPAAPGSVPQAEPPNIPWSDWAHKHMTALRNAIFATIPEEEKNANMGDEALVAWPAELLKRLNVAAGAAQPGDDKPGEK